MVRLVLVASAFGALSVSAAYAANTGDKGDFMSRHYPPEALKNGEEGKVGFSVHVSDAGRIEQCQITESSGYPTLDRETCDFIVEFARFGAVKDAEGKVHPSTKTGVVNWTLPAGVPKSKAVKMAELALPEPLVCKRTTASGSNRAKVTHCMTKAEWALQDKLVRQDLEETVGRRRCTPEGC